MVNLINTTFKLMGITCSACQKLITKRVQLIGGVSKVTVDLSNGQTNIFADHQITNSELTKALEDTPYKIT